MDKSQQYRQVLTEIEAVLDGESNLTARYATTACMLSQAFSHFFWTGFYLVDPQKPDELVVGPYQGSLGCLRIPFGKGVCGTAALTGTTILVDNVDEFPGHIACDSRSASEIVVPVFDAQAKLQAVLDVDSTQLAAFDAIDQKGLEQICQRIWA